MIVSVPGPPQGKIEMYANPRRINRNAKLGQLEVMMAFTAATIKCVAAGDDIGAGMYASKSWHAAKLAGTELVKASKRKNY